MLLPFSISKHFPVIELMFSNHPIAMIVTRTGQLKLVKIKPILNTFFVCEYGWFRLRSDRKLSIYKQSVYLYSGANYNPLDPQALKEIEIHCKKTNRTELEKYVEIQLEEQTKNDIELINNDYEHEIKLEQTGEFTEEQIQQAPEIETEHKEMIESVARSIREPINFNVEQFLSQYCEVNPQSIKLGLKEILAAEKHLKSMSRNITTVIPLATIAMILVGAVIFFTNFETIATQISNVFSGGLGF